MYSLNVELKLLEKLITLFITFLKDYAEIYSYIQILHLSLYKEKNTFKAYS